MGGQTQTKQAVSNTNQTIAPYAPAVPAVNSIINAATPQIGNAALTGTEQNALGGLAANAAAGNPYAPGIGSLANNLLAGGTDRTGYATGAYNTLQSQLTPYANMDTNPYSNPAFTNYANTLTNDLTDRIKSQYAGAGYSPTSSGDFGQQLGRGISQGLAPTWLQAYNDLSGQKLGAINSLYNAGNTTAGVLSGLDQTALGNRLQGVGVGQQALDANNYGYNQALGIEALRRGIPISNLGALSNLIVPMAKLGGNVQGVGTENSTVTTPTPWTQYAGLGIAGLGLL